MQGMKQPSITQAMIDAYDEYTHLTLDRRGFMEKLTKLAGSGAAAGASTALLLRAHRATAAAAHKASAAMTRVLRLKVELIVSYSWCGCRVSAHGGWPCRQGWPGVAAGRVHPPPAARYRSIQACMRSSRRATSASAAARRVRRTSSSSARLARPPW